MKIYVQCAPETSPALLKKEGADGVILAVPWFSFEGGAAFDEETIRKQIRKYQENGLECCLLADRYFPEEELDALKGFLNTFLPLCDGLYYADPGVYAIAESLGKKEQLIYQDDPVIASKADAAAYGSLGLKRFVLSPDIHIRELEEAVKASPQAEAVIYGHLRLSVSRRQYLKAFGISRGGEARLREENREERMMIREDSSGSRIYREKPVTALPYLPLLEKAGLNYIQIRGLFLSSEEIIAVLETIRNGEGLMPEADGGFYQRNGRKLKI